MPAKPDRGTENLQDCPMCGSPFDSRRHQLVACVECGGEGSTACCVEDGEVCARCRDA